MSDYATELAWLYGLRSRGAKLGLERITSALDARSNPERELCVVHVAGTNGKGSTCALLEAALRAAGYKTGWLSSPHLHRYVERIRVAGEAISEVEAAQRLEDLRSDQRLESLTFFEITTILALESFKDAKCDIVILEVGLGGRLDASNVVTPEVSVITEISKDHERVLGKTLAKIAKEKAGIIKPGVPVVAGATDSAAQRTIEKQALEQRAPVWWIERDFGVRGRGSQRALWASRETIEEVRLGLKGEHQWQNAACAYAALACLGMVGWKCPDEKIREGFSSLRWPGRLETLRGKPSFLFDVAHNPSACEALAQYIREKLRKEPIVLLFGAMQDKDHKAMLNAFKGVVDRYIYAAPEIERAADPAIFSGIQRGQIAKSARDALARAKRIAGEQGLIVVAGSIFLVSEVRAIVKDLPNDPLIRL